MLKISSGWRQRKQAEEAASVRARYRVIAAGIVEKRADRSDGRDSGRVEVMTGGRTAIVDEKIKTAATAAVSATTVGTCTYNRYYRFCLDFPPSLLVHALCLFARFLFWAFARHRRRLYRYFSYLALLYHVPGIGERAALFCCESTI